MNKIILTIFMFLLTGLTFAGGSIEEHASSTFGVNGPYEGITTLVIDAVESDVYIAETDTDAIFIVDSVIRTGGKSKSNVIMNEDSTLTFKQGEHRGKLVKSEGSIVIEVPKETLIKLDIEASSGDVQIDVPVNNLVINASSGDIVVNSSSVNILAEISSGSMIFNGNGDNLKAKVSSGDLIVNAPFNTADVKVSSGKIDIYKGGDSLIAENSSGSIMVRESFVTQELKTSSGDIQATVGVNSTILDIEMSSGEMLVVFEDEIPYSLNFDASSGTFFDTYTGVKSKGNYVYNNANATVDIIVHTSSGDLTFIGLQ